MSNEFSSAALDTRAVPRRAGLWLLLAALLFAAATVAAFSVDLPIARSLAGPRVLPGDVVRLISMSEAFAYGGTAALILLTATLLDVNGRRRLLRAAICVYGAGLTTDVVKTLVARIRPRHFDLKAESLGVFDTFQGWAPYWGDRLQEIAASSSLLPTEQPLALSSHAIQSFPSGHATAGVALAISLILLYRRGWPMFVLLGALACFQRMSVGAHFFSDVLAGAAVASAWAALLYARPLGGRIFDRWEEAAYAGAPAGDKS